MFRQALFLLRFVIAAVFIVSGFEKATSPSENFLYVLQAYDIFPHFLEGVISVIFPWIELAMGVFLALGLWLRPVCGAIALTTGTFIMVLGQAILRHLPIDSCGCFGNLVHLPMQVTIFFDLGMLACAVLFINQIAALEPYSLDGIFKKSGS